MDPKLRYLGPSDWAEIERLHNGVLRRWELPNGYTGIIDEYSWRVYNAEIAQRTFERNNAFYDLKQKVFVDAIVQRSRQANEYRTLEGFNNLACIQESAGNSYFAFGYGGIASGFDIHKFDLPVSLSLSNKKIYSCSCQQREKPL